MYCIERDKYYHTMTAVSSNTIDDLVSSAQTMTIRAIPQNYPTMYYHKNKDHILPSQKVHKKKVYDELKDSKTHCDICNVDIHPVNWSKHTATAKHKRGGTKLEIPETYYCEICDKTVGYRAKNNHLTSKRHIDLQNGTLKQTPDVYHCELCNKDVSHLRRKSHFASKKHIALHHAADQTQPE